MCDRYVHSPYKTLTANFFLLQGLANGKGQKQLIANISMGKEQAQRIR